MFAAARPSLSDSGRHLRLITAICLIGCCGIAAAAAKMPRPGNYEVTTSSNFGGLPVTQTLNSCITAEQLESDPQKVFADAPAADNCDLEEFNMADGILSMKMNCTAEDGSIYVTTDGSYTRNSYTMNTRITINTAGTEIISNAKITGKRIGDC